MLKFKLHTFLRSAGLLIAVAACVTTPSPAQRAEPPMGPEAAIARARVDSLRYPYTTADIEFMQGMIHHHAQALVMSSWAPTNGASAELLRLTARIINAQNDEIVLMQMWLRDRNQPTPVVDAHGMVSMPGDEHAGHMGHQEAMPGMLTDAQMTELKAARGPEFDRLFLTYMIQHHRGAVAMVQTLLTSPNAGQDETIFKFAADVEVDQSTEIRRMLQMLITLDP
jgi:uncharacterized protein (DUF305 family)